ncbi:uncharacterized protein LOC143680122 [Tamandua tetradactyla]|uniref:uncharacterized protein LOC143680122 n=1 Tax=Tamandua tetradactyla TaxID=48850 RepID=UPI004054738B
MFSCCLPVGRGRGLRRPHGDSLLRRCRRWLSSCPRNLWPCTRRTHRTSIRKRGPELDDYDFYTIPVTTRPVDHTNSSAQRRLQGDENIGTDVEERRTVNNLQRTSWGKRTEDRQVSLQIHREPCVLANILGNGGYITRHQQVLDQMATSVKMTLLTTWRSQTWFRSSTGPVGLAPEPCLVATTPVIEFVFKTICQGNMRTRFPPEQQVWHLVSRLHGQGGGLRLHKMLALGGQKCEEDPPRDLQSKPGQTQSSARWWTTWAVPGVPLFVLCKHIAGKPAKSLCFFIYNFFPWPFLRWLGEEVNGLSGYCPLYNACYSLNLLCARGSWTAERWWPRCCPVPCQALLVPPAFRPAWASGHWGPRGLPGVPAALLSSEAALGPPRAAWPLPPPARCFPLCPLPPHPHRPARACSGPARGTSIRWPGSPGLSLSPPRCQAPRPRMLGGAPGWSWLALKPPPGSWECPAPGLVQP